MVHSRVSIIIQNSSLMYSSSHKVSYSGPCITDKLIGIYVQGIGDRDRDTGGIVIAEVT